MSTPIKGELMYLSIFVGPFTRDARDDVAVIDMCIDQATRAAEAGFAMVTFGEQHYNDYEPYCNPFIMAGRMATSLGDAWLGTTIVPLVFHHPLRLAEDSSVADLLLRGRFQLGVSAARVGPVPDWDNFGIEQSDRDELFATNLQILRSAFAYQPGDPPLRYDNKWGRGALNGRLMPASWRAGGPSLAIGTSTDATIDRVGADGMPLLLGPCPPAVAAAKFGRHRHAMAQAGYPADAIEVAASHSLVTRNVVVAETDDEAWTLAEKLSGNAPFMDRTSDNRSMREMAAYDLSDAPYAASAFGMKGDPVVRNSSYVQGWLIVGDPDSVTRQLKEYETLDIPHVNLRYTVGRYDPDLGTPGDFDRSFDLFLGSVMPQLDTQQYPALRKDEIRAAYLGH
jgi:alkanesulfonate monooxygenase SsuD/methylene tetrahydromethanopterin reductase-like flavin-dependent oxidoreductase (luciferase family)